MDLESICALFHATLHMDVNVRQEAEKNLKIVSFPLSFTTVCITMAIDQKYKYEEIFNSFIVFIANGHSYKRFVYTS